MLRTYSLFGLLLSFTACAADDPFITSTTPGSTGSGSDPAKPNAPGSPNHQGGNGNGGTGNGHKPGNSLGNCDGTRTFAQPVSPDILIVQDRSSSMVGVNATGVSRWAPSVAAIGSAVSELESRVRFGLLTFPSSSDPTGCSVGEPEVYFTLGAASEIDSALAANVPTVLPPAHTPTGPALEKAYDIINSRLADGAIGNAYVILVTDGAPTCGADLLSTSPETIGTANDAVDKLHKNGVRTFVIGYGITEPQGRDIMDGMAERGGTQRFIPVEDEQSLRSELKAIANRLTPCTYYTGTETEPGEVKVTIDKDTIELSAADGWSINGTTVQLNGPACERIQDGKVHDVEVIVPCPVLY